MYGDFVDNPTRELSWFDENNKLQQATVIEIECSDIRPMYDTFITCVEAYGGWWYVWSIGGELCAYFVPDEKE